MCSQEASTQEVYLYWRANNKNKFYYNTYDEFVKVGTTQRTFVRTQKQEEGNTSNASSSESNVGNSSTAAAAASSTLTANQATIEQGFRATYKTTQGSDNDFSFISALLDLTKCGSLKWDLFSGIFETAPLTNGIGRKFMVIPAAAPHSMSTFEFVVNALLKNSQDGKMIWI